MNTPIHPRRRAARLAAFLLLFLSQPLLAYYCPSTGRFLSRDPVGERGGTNVYSFVRNAPVHYVDALGLSPSTGSYDACGCDRKAINLKIVEMSRKAAKMSATDFENIPEQIRKHGKSVGREFGGRICCDKETKAVSATGPSRSKSGDNGWIKDPSPQKLWWIGRSIDITRDSPACPKGSTEVARYHSHPGGSDCFSPEDLNTDALDKRPLGLGVPSGKVSIIEPILGDRILPQGQGTIHGVTLKIMGWGVNDDGTLFPKPVIPTDGTHTHLVTEIQIDANPGP